MQKKLEPLQSYKMSNLETQKTYALIANPLNNRLIARLSENSEEVIIFPAVKTSVAALNDDAIDFIKNPSNFGWIVFTDVFAADYFIEAMREYETDFFELDSLTVCAVGEAVADRLRFVQIHADVIPANSTDETIFSTISQYAGDDLREQRFLVLRERSKTLNFVELLQNEKAAIEELPIYEAAFDNEPELTKIKTLLKGGAIDVFIFSSAEDVSALKLLYSENDLGKILNDIKAFATTEIAFQTLQENGLRPLYFHYK